MPQERGDPHPAARHHGAQRGRGGGHRRGPARGPPTRGATGTRRGARRAHGARGPQWRTATRSTPNGSPRLTRAAGEGGKGEGNPSTSSARQRRAAAAQGGSPQHSPPEPPPAEEDQHARLGRGDPVLVLVLFRRGVPVGCAGGNPPCRCCTPLVRAAGRGVPLPLPPLSGRSR